MNQVALYKKLSLASIILSVMMFAIALVLMTKVDDPPRQYVFERLNRITDEDVFMILIVALILALFALFFSRRARHFKEA